MRVARRPGARMESATTAAKNAMAITYGSGSNTSSPDIVGIPLRRTLATADPPSAPQTKPMTMGRLIGARMARTTWLGAGAERDAQSDLARALRHGVAGEAGQPDDREQDGHGAQDRDHRERGGGFLPFPGRTCP